MPKAHDDGNGSVCIWCEGCKEVHILYVSNPNTPNWTFNGDLEKPTFQPSLLVRTGHYVSNQPQPPNCKFCNDPDFADCRPCTVCHSFITDGKIQYLSDCTHALAGKTIELSEFKWRE